MPDGNLFEKCGNNCEILCSLLDAYVTHFSSSSRILSIKHKTIMETDHLAVYANPEGEAFPSDRSTITHAAGDVKADLFPEHCNYKLNYD